MKKNSNQTYSKWLDCRVLVSGQEYLRWKLVQSVIWPHLLILELPPFPSACTTFFYPLLCNILFLHASVLGMQDWRIVAAFYDLSFFFIIPFFKIIFFCTFFLSYYFPLTYSLHNLWVLVSTVVMTLACWMEKRARLP